LCKRKKLRKHKNWQKKKPIRLQRKPLGKPKKTRTKQSPRKRRAMRKKLSKLRLMRLKRLLTKLHSRKQRTP